MKSRLTNSIISCLQVKGIEPIPRSEVVDEEANGTSETRQDFQHRQIYPGRNGTTVSIQMYMKLSDYKQKNVIFTSKY